MCVLRVASRRRTLTDFLSEARIPYYETHDRDTPMRFGSQKGKPYGYAGFKSDVSTKEWDDLPGQISDAIRFLRRHKADLKRLKTKFQVSDVRLDFPHNLRIGQHDIVAQFDYLPPNLISLAGELGIGIELSLYTAPSSPRSGRMRKGAGRRRTEANDESTDL